MSILETGKLIPNYSEDVGLKEIKYVRFGDVVSVGTINENHSYHAITDGVYDRDFGGDKPGVDDGGNIRLPTVRKKEYTISDYVPTSVIIKSIVDLNDEEYLKEFKAARMESARYIANATGISVRILFPEKNNVVIDPDN